MPEGVGVPLVSHQVQLAEHDRHLPRPSSQSLPGVSCPRWPAGGLPSMSRSASVWQSEMIMRGTPPWLPPLSGDACSVSAYLDVRVLADIYTATFSAAGLPASKALYLLLGGGSLGDLRRLRRRLSVPAILKISCSSMHLQGWGRKTPVLLLFGGVFTAMKKGEGCSSSCPGGRRTRELSLSATSISPSSPPARYVCLPPPSGPLLLMISRTCAMASWWR